MRFNRFAGLGSPGSGLAATNGPPSMERWRGYASNSCAICFFPGSWARHSPLRTAPPQDERRRGQRPKAFRRSVFGRALRQRTRRYERDRLHRDPGGWCNAFEGVIPAASVSTFRQRPRRSAHARPPDFGRLYASNALSPVCFSSALHDTHFRGRPRPPRKRRGSPDS